MSDRIRRIAVTAVVAVSVLLGVPLTASAAPAPTASDPVQVTLERLEPHDVQADSTISVTVVLRNTTANSTGPLLLRLRRGGILDTRGELQAADATRPGTGFASAPALEVPGGLAPGQGLRQTYTTPASGLALSAGNIGVYPIALTAQRAEDGEELGRVSTFLPFLPSGISGTRVTLLWPLLDRPHRLTGSPPGKAEVFTDDALARSVARGGRLDVLLSAAEAVTGKVRLTLVIDPEVIEALDRMTDPGGYRVGLGGKTVAGVGGSAATAWLARLRAIAPKHLLVATPYADPDLVALERGGFGTLGRYQQPDLDATARILGVLPDRRVAWPPDGQLTSTSLDDEVAQGATAVVLGANALTGGDTATARTQSGVSPLPALSGSATALVSDPVVQNILDRGALKKGGFAGGPRLAEQRLLAELAMITAEAPNDSRTIVLSPPRRWDPPATYAAGLADDVASLPWMTEVDALTAAGSTEPVDRGALTYSNQARSHEVTPTQIRNLGTVQSQVSDFRSALNNQDAGTELAPYGDAVRRASSSAWRGAAAHAGAAYTARLVRQINTLRSKVTLSASATGDYTLASSDSPLLLTLQNRLTVPVSVRIRLTTPPGFAIKDPGIRQIPAGGKLTVKVLASVQRTGQFSVQGQVTTPGGGVLGDRITYSVRSTAYGGLALGLTGLAFAVLVGAVLFRLYRRWKARGTAAPVAAGSPADRSLT